MAFMAKNEKKIPVKNNKHSAHNVCINARMRV